MVPECAGEQDVAIADDAGWKTVAFVDLGEHEFRHVPGGVVESAGDEVDGSGEEIDNHDEGVKLGVAVFR